MAITTRYARDAVLKDLRENVLEVTFTKVDGSQRIMRCTLDSRYLPPQITENHVRHIDEEHLKKENLSTIAAWDVQNGGWRSFRIDSLHYVQVVDGY